MIDRLEAKELLQTAAECSIAYLEGLEARGVAPTAEAVANLSALEEGLPAQPADARETLRLLDTVGSPATMGMAGPRFFGFVIGGSLPVTLAANWLAGAWDQNAVFFHHLAHHGAGRKGGAGLAGGSLRAAGGERGRLRQRGDDGEPVRAGRRAPRAAGAGGLERGGGRAVWRAAGHGGGGRGSARLTDQGAGDVGLWPHAGGEGAGGRAGAHARGRAATALGANDRLPAGGQRQHRRVRPVSSDHPTSAGGGRLGARRRRVWAVGRGGPRAGRAGGWDGGSRLVGHGRAQVAERALRQRAGLRARSARAARRDGGHGGVPAHRRARTATRPTIRRSFRGARAGWRCGRRCARWAARGSAR